MWSTSGDSLRIAGAVQCTLPATSLSPLPLTSSLNLVRPKSLTCSHQSTQPRFTACRVPRAVCACAPRAVVNAHLDVPLGVEQQVEGLEVAVHDARRVQEVHALGGLVGHLALQL